jgi:hypothetical protein
MAGALPHPAAAGDTGEHGVRLTRPLTRALLVAAGVLVVTVGVPLIFWPAQTDEGFAWTIDPALTAAFLGGAYWSAAAVEFTASRERTWAATRTAVPGVLLFTVLTLVATLLHLDRFHLDECEPLARVVAWGWLVVYVSFPLAMGTALVWQRRVPGVDPPRIDPMPSWVHVVLRAQAALLLGYGALLFVWPDRFARYWPWALTPLTGRAIAAWLIGLGVTAAQMSFENDWHRVRAGVVGSGLFVVFEVVMLARYPGTVEWAEPGAWLLVAWFAAMATVAVAGVRALRGHALT